MDLDQSADTLDTPFPDAAVMSEADDGGHVGKLSGTRRSFVKGIAAAGASTMAAYAIDGTGVAELFAEDAAAQTPNAFASFTALAPSAADAFQVPEGYRAEVVLGYGDAFANTDGTQLTFGYNNDFLAFFPLPAGSENSNEGLLFINHEYPGPFLQHGQKDARPKTLDQIELERDSVGNSIVHVQRDREGVFRVVTPSAYNRRITGKAPECRFTGPLAGDAAYPGVGTSARGSLANCSGGITPWGTALSCEENFQDYGSTSGSGYGWTGPSAPASEPTAAVAPSPTNPTGSPALPPPATKLDTDDYYNGDGTAASPPAPGPDFAPRSTGDSLKGPAKYGWVVETDPYDASFQPRKHTGLGRFRHENTAFRAAPNKPFVLYMGDDRQNGGVYKFVSTRPFVPGRREQNLRILEEGQLYIASWSPEGRRRFSPAGELLTAQQGTGQWRPVAKEELVDTQRLITAAVGGSSAFNASFATNRPEDVEVSSDGTVWIALTNNATAGVNDIHGSIRTLSEAGNDPTALTFTWEDFAAGGPRPGAPAGQEGFSSPDNLVFDRNEDLWVVTDISSSALNVPGNPNQYHANNAVFYVPRSGPNRGVAFRFANMPIQAEGTGPYFTPDERTLFVNVQHPGEESDRAPGQGDDNAAGEAGLTSFWPRGNITTGQNPGKPIPSVVAVTKLPPRAEPAAQNTIPAPPPGLRPDGTPAPDRTRPLVALLGRGRQQVETLRGRGIAFPIQVDEPVTIVATLRGRLTSRGGRGRGRERRLAQTTLRIERPGRYTLRLRPSAALRVLLRRERRLPAALLIRATDRAGNVSTRRKRVDFV